ncbi:MAG TPA: YceI family protein [Oleiagrimonas sp.]|nr:YceI family protein [Oleiagrimonas sp.]
MNSLSRYLLAWMLVVLLGVVVSPAFASGRTFVLDPHHTQVRVSWNHLGFSHPSAFMRIGKGMLVWDGEHPSRSSVRVTIPMSSIHTQVSALDARLRSHVFEAGKYPVATFRSTNVERVGQMDVYRIQGVLTLHGIVRPISLTATVNRYGINPVLKAPAIGFNAVATIKRSAFGLNAGLPLVGDKVRVHITAEAIPPEALARRTRAIKARIAGAGPDRPGMTGMVAASR